jgi:hypothetical protein
MKEIEGHPGYWVTDSGDVYCTRSNAGFGCKPLRKLKPELMRGYSRFSLSINGVVRREFVHRLVAKAFIGPPPEGKNIIRHLDGNPSNNNASNLVWGNYRENEADKKRHGRSLTGDKNHFSKLTWDDVMNIRAMLKGGENIMSVARHFKLSTCAVSRINTNKSWCDPDWAPVNTRAGERHEKARLTWQNVRDIRARLAKGERNFILAKEYKIPSSSISLIKSGATWKE